MIRIKSRPRNWGMLKIVPLIGRSELCRAAILYSCPNTRQTVQGFVAEEVPDDAYELITCLACRQIHFVNPTTGKVLGEYDPSR